jgi:GntR family transcriptional regulator
MQMKDYIDKVVPIPYYAQLKQILINRMDNGDFSEGKISSENELAQRYDVAVSTVRKALTQLIYEGKIYRVKGVGTFIKKPKLEIDIAKYLSLGRILKEKGLIERIEITKGEIVDFSDININSFEIKNPSKKAVHIERVRYINDEPLAMEKLYYNNDTCSQIIDKASNGLMTDYFINELRINFASVDEYLEPINLREEEARLLNTSKNMAALLITKISYDQNGNWLEFSKTIIRGDQCRSHVKVK